MYNHNKNKNENKKIYLTHIPKTAGTSLEEIVYQAGHKKNKNYIIGIGYYKKFIKKNIYHHKNFLKEEYLKKFINYEDNGHWNMQFFHIPLSFWKDEILLRYKKEYHIFCVVRNPYDRYVSDFKFWIKFYNDTKKEKNLEIIFKNLLKHLEEIYENNFTLSEENLNKICYKLLSTKKYYYSLDGHLIPQYKYVYTKINNKLIKITDNILRFENLENDFLKFKNKYLPLITNNAIKKTYIHKTDDIINKNLLNKVSRELIYKYYKNDFLIFKYKKEY